MTFRAVQVPAGVDGHHAGTEVRVELLRGLNEINRTIVAIGSDVLVLDLAASALRATKPLITLASSTEPHRFGSHVD